MDHDELRLSPEWDATIRRAASLAAAEVVSTASAAAAQVASTAAQAAHALAESTRIDLRYIKEDLQEIKTRLDSKYVTVDVFEPVRNVVYGLVALMLVGVVTGLLALVLRPH